MGEGRLYCPACGTPAEGEPAQCSRCGAPLLLAGRYALVQPITWDEARGTATWQAVRVRDGHATPSSACRPARHTTPR
ncbi:MAG: hypothetical protein R3F59_37495 [Myxococcota bacterium]